MSLRRKAFTRACAIRNTWGFLIMFGFLIQWPTPLTLMMFPVLVLMYVRLSLSEERQTEQEFGQAWRDYAGRTPRFVPRLSSAGQRPTTPNRA